MAEQAFNKAAVLTKELTAEQLITENLDIWTSAIEQKSASGRGSSKKFSLHGIKKLRELILELAVRGKLVPQASREARNSEEYEPASVLLERIAAEKAQLVKDKKIKKPKALPEISEDEKPFELPKGWGFSRLGVALTKITDGTHHSPPNSDSGAYFYISAKNIKNDGVQLSNATYVTKEQHDEIYARCNPEFGDLLYIKDGATTGIVAINQLKEPFSMLSSVALLKCPTCILNKYLLIALRSPFFYGEIRAGMTGVAITRVTLKKLDNAFIPLPPLEEQHRIVAKVDELMSLCDALEAQTEASLSAHQTLVEVLLNGLIADDSGKTAMDGGNVESAGATFDRVAEHFDTLFTTSASIDTLKQTILQLAVMGKLVEQASCEARNSANYEPAAKLLERIAAEKAQLIADKKIKKQKPLPAITDEEKPFELPNGWEWVRFGNLVNFKAELVRPEEFLDYDQVAPDSIEKGTGKLLKRRTVRDSGVKGPNSRFYAGQILYSKIRPSLSKAVIAEFDGLCSADMYPLQSMINSQYLLKSILSEVFLEQVRIAENRIKMPKLNIDSLSDIKLPLAPAEEQHRIVAKVDELMALCDQLKARLADAQTTQLHLTDTIVEQAV